MGKKDILRKKLETKNASSGDSSRMHSSAPFVRANNSGRTRIVREHIVPEHIRDEYKD